MKKSLNRFSEWLTLAGKVAAGLLTAALVLYLLVAIGVGMRSTPLRIQPFEASEALTKAGWTGTALAQTFRDRVRAIDRTVTRSPWVDNQQPGENQRSGVVFPDITMLDAKVPGTDLSLDRLVDFLLAALGREVMVNGIATSRTGEPAGKGEATIAIRTNGHAFHAVHTPFAAEQTNLDSMNALLGQAAEAFYLEQRPCDLALYLLSLPKRAAECEVPARRCAFQDPALGYNIWGVCELHRGYPQAAAAKLGHALAAARFDAASAERQASILNNWGTVMAEVGDDVAAIQKYDAAILAKDTYARAWCNRGLALLRQHRLAAAAESFDRTIAADPTFAPGYINRAYLLYSNMKYEESAQLLKRAHGRLPDDPDVAFNLAVAEKAAGHRDAALADYDRVIDLDPARADAWEGEAALLGACGRVAAAAEVLRGSLAHVAVPYQSVLQSALGEARRHLAAHPEPPGAVALSCDRDAASHGAGSTGAAQSPL